MHRKACLMLTIREHCNPSGLYFSHPDHVCHGRLFMLSSYTELMDFLLCHVYRCVPEWRQDQAPSHISSFSEDLRRVHYHQTVVQLSYMYQSLYYVTGLEPCLMSWHATGHSCKKFLFKGSGEFVKLGTPIDWNSEQCWGRGGDFGGAPRPPAQITYSVTHERGGSGGGGPHGKKNRNNK